MSPLGLSASMSLRSSMYVLGIARSPHSAVLSCHRRRSSAPNKGNPDLLLPNYCNSSGAFDSMALEDHPGRSQRCGGVTGPSFVIRRSSIPLRLFLRIGERPLFFLGQKFYHAAPPSYGLRRQRTLADVDSPDLTALDLDTFSFGHPWVRASSLHCGAILSIADHPGGSTIRVPL